MIKLTTAALFFLAAGVFTSVTVLGAYQILFAIPLIFYTYKAASGKEKLKLPTSAWFLIAFTVVALISLFVNYELIPKPSKNFGKLKYFIYGFGGIFVFRVWLEEATDKAKKILIHTLFLSIVVAGVYAVYSTKLTIDGRAKALTETMRYGYGSGMVLLMLLSAILQRKYTHKWFNLKTAIPVFIVGFIGMYSTYTRGALLGFICGIPFVLYYYNKKIGLIFGGLSLAGVAILGSFYLFGSGDYQSRFLVNKNNPSDNIRFSQWKAAVVAIEEKPVLGWGLSNFHTQLKRIKIEHDLAAKEYSDAHSHNVFLEIASGTGFVGLFFFLGWLIFWALESFRKEILTKSLIIPFGVAFIVSSQFEVTLDANNASMIFFLYAFSSARNRYVE